MLPGIDKNVRDQIVSFIRNKVKESRASGVVLSISGGIDSALTLKLCVEALGPQKVHALILPDTSVPGTDETDASSFASSLGVHLHRFFIGGIVDSFVSAAGVGDRKTIGNIKARTRMIFNYAIANSENLLVAGTSNKSEFATGYYTKFGDGASDFCPIGDLYKTQVRKLAEAVGLPAVFLEKTPTAGLWPGQSDEEEMGITYPELDKILYSMESGQEPADIPAKTGITPEKVQKVVAMIASSRHKRSLPPVPRIGERTIGVDWTL